MASSTGRYYEGLPWKDFTYPEDDLVQIEGAPWILRLVRNEPGLERTSKMTAIEGMYAINIVDLHRDVNLFQACMTMRNALDNSSTPSDPHRPACKASQPLVRTMDLSGLDCAWRPSDLFRTSCERCEVQAECRRRCGQNIPTYVEPSWQPRQGLRPYLGRARRSQPSDDRCELRPVPQAGSQRNVPTSGDIDDCELFCETMEIDRTRCVSSLRTDVRETLGRINPRLSSFLEALGDVAYLAGTEGDTILRWNDNFRESAERLIRRVSIFSDRKGEWSPTLSVRVRDSVAPSDFFRHLSRDFRDDLLDFRRLFALFQARFVEHCEDAAQKHN